MSKGKMILIGVALLFAAVVVGYVVSEPDAQREKVQQELKDHKEKCKKQPSLFECQPVTP